MTNADGVIIQANPAFEKITGYTVAEAIGSNRKLLKPNRHSPEFYQNMWDQIEGHPTSYSGLTVNQ